MYLLYNRSITLFGGLIGLREGANKWKRGSCPITNNSCKPLETPSCPYSGVNLPGELPTHGGTMVGKKILKSV
jgi:hypothetical protein